MDLKNPPQRPLVRRATCLSSDAVGDCVKISGPEVGGLLQVTKMDPAEEGTSQSVGVIKSKSAATICQVQLFGLLKGVYSGLTEGARLFVGTDSRLTETVPTPGGAGQVMYLQLMGVATRADEVEVQPSSWPIKQRG